MAKMGRPLKEINQKTFENLCAIQCTLVEIAGVFDCCEDTIENWCKRTYKETFSEVYKKKSAMGKMSLRRNMFKQAEKNATMAIWLSKQHLGMTDKIEKNETDDRIADTLQGLLSTFRGEDNAN